VDSVGILRELVSFDTTSHRSNLEMIDRVADRLESYGARVRLTRDETGLKANMLASFGPEVRGGVLLSGHTDVIPADGRRWAGDPFTLRERDGRLYGRGSADMKGFIAACLGTSPRWRDAPLVRPVHLAFTHDEETGALGVPRLVDDLVRNVPLPALAIVGEPTGMRVADRHRGYMVFRSEFHGRTAHSSDPAQGVSAIAAAARFVAALGAEPEIAGVRGAPPAAGSAGDAGRGERTTVNVGRIRGGGAVNAVPEDCAVLWEMRPAPTADLASLRAAVGELARGAAGPGVTVDTRETVTVPPLCAERRNAAAEVARELGARPRATGLPYGSEAGFFQAAGIPTAVCGPGSIDQAHEADEWIAIEQLERATRFLSRLTYWAARPEA
jgi:acetylornithine deacetylase